MPGLIQRITIVIVSLLAAQVCIAEVDQQPTAFKISHFYHPEMASFKTLIEKTYRQTGIEVTFTELPAARGLIQLNKGAFDADVVRLDTSIGDFENLIRIQPALVNAEILLLCLMDTPCNQEVLLDPNNLIASNIGNQNTLSELTMNATIIHDESNTHTIDMLKKGRVNYVIYGTNRRNREALAQEFLISVLKTETMYHVVHKKHKAIIPVIEKSLHEALILFDSSRR